MAHPSAFRRVLSAAAIVAAVPALAGPVYTTYFFESLRPAALGTTHAAGILCSPGPLDCQLWITDGTIGGTRAVPSPLGEAIPRRDVISVGNAVYFIGLQRFGEGPVNEDRVWRTDGTTAGTRAVTNGFPPQAFRKPAAAGSTLVYITTQGLWRTEGGYSDTFKIADLVAGEQEQDLASAGGFVYFGKGDIDHGGEVWRTDGTIAGTAMWMDVNPGSASSNASGFKQANGKLYFGATVGGTRMLMGSDGTAAGTEALMPITNSAFSIAAGAGFTVVFHPHMDGTQIWRTDGTAAGTSSLGVFDFIAPTLMPDVHATLGAHVYFEAAGSSESQIWRTDGTAAGTEAVPGVPASPIPRGLTVAGGLLYFESNGIWRSDGTASNTFRISPTTKATRWIPIGNKLLFSSGDGNELWITDGTLAGTHAVGAAEGPATTYQLSSASYSTSEVGSTTVTVTRSGSEGAASVRWTTSNSSAVAGQHFGMPGNTELPSGVFTWSDGDNSARTITIGGPAAMVPLIDNTTTEPLGHYFGVSLVHPSPGTSLGEIRDSAVHILDNEPGFAFTQADQSVPEGAGVATITVRRSGSTAAAGSVRWTTLASGASPGLDYGVRGRTTESTGVLSWAAGDAANKSFTIPILQDGVTEQLETIAVRLSSPAGGGIGTSAETGSITLINILDDELPAESRFRLWPDKLLVMENAGNAAVRVIREAVNGGFALPATVRYSTMPGNALASSDYTPRTGSITWAASDASEKVILIPITNDSVAEGHESFTVQLSTTSPGSMVTVPQSTVTIIDDDDAFPKFGVVPEDWIVPEGATAGWHASNDVGAYQGAFSLRSDQIEDGQSAQVQVTREFLAGTVAFRVKISSELTFDRLRFFVDGVQKGAWSGTTNTGWQVFSMTLAAGAHTLRWSYEKDSSASVGQDAAWIDGVALP